MKIERAKGTCIPLTMFDGKYSQLMPSAKLSSMSANRAKIVFVCKHLQKKLTSFIPHSRIWR
jgi:hypothetical protein